MRIFFYEEIDKENFDIYKRKLKLKCAYKATSDFMVVSRCYEDTRSTIEGKAGDYIVKGINDYFVVSEKSFDNLYQTGLIKEDFQNVLSFYKRRINKDEKF